MEIFDEKQLEKTIIEMCTLTSYRRRFDQAEELIKQYADCGYKVQYMYCIVDTYRLEEGKK